MISPIRDRSQHQHTARIRPWCAVAVAIAVGAAIRIIEVAQGHALGFDDTSLAINIATRSIALLTHPLAFQQAAPILFLWIDRSLASLLGFNGVVLRLMPLVAGVALLPLTWIVGRRLVGEPAALVVVCLLAVSPLAVDYSNTTKPYMVDAAVALLALGMTLRVLHDPARRDFWLALTAGGALIILLSTPAAFTLAACAATLVLTPRVRRASAARLLVLGLIWGTVGVANYFAFQRATAHNASLQRFWAPLFFNPGAPDLGTRVRVVASSYIQNIFFGTDIRVWIPVRIAVVPLVAIGAAHTWRRTGRAAVALLAGPLGLAIIAAIVGLYPPSDRTWLFAVPSVALLAGAGLVALAEVLPHRFQGSVVAAAGVATLLLPGRQSLLTLQAQLHPDEIQSALHAWRSAAVAGEPIYVFSRDALRWAYITTNWSNPDTARLNWLLAAAAAIGPNSGNAPSRGHAVREEGNGLVYRGAGRAELIGVPTGMEDGGPSPANTPDTGWAENEARRLATVARSSSGGDVWAFFLYGPPQVDSDIVAASEQDGAHVTSARRFGAVRLYELQFSPATLAARPSLASATRPRLAHQ